MGRWLVLALLYVSAWGQGAVPGTYFGMTVQNFMAVQPAVGFGTVRTWDAYDGGWDSTPGLDWAHIETARGVYDFRAVDRYLDWAEKRHAEVIYTFGRTPRWASAMPDRTGHYGVGECGAPARMEDWDDFVGALARHVHGRVRLWELWNEPNDPEAYCGDVGTMVRMAREAARILKGVDAGAVVLSPGVVSDGGPAWLESFLAAGGGSSVDVIGFHGYWSGKAEDLVQVVARYRAVAARHGQAGKPLWDTEASWAGRHGGADGLTDNRERAAFLAKYFLLHWSLGVQRLVWYAYDGQEIWGRLVDGAGALKQDGLAYAQVRGWILGVTVREPCRADGWGTWRCRLTRSNGWEGTVLWNSGASVVTEVERQYRLVIDASGREEKAGKLIRVDNLPVLLETGPYS